MSQLLPAARAEAARLQHDYLGTEHLLLALVQTADPTLTTILSAFSVTPEQLRERLEQRSPKGRGTPEDPEAIALRSGARRALDQARAAAGGAEPGSIELLGSLMADGRGVVAASLGDLGVPVVKVREALGIAPPAPPAPAEPTAEPTAESAPPPVPAEGRKKKDRGQRQEQPRQGAEKERPPKGERPPRPEKGERAEGREERGDRTQRREREPERREREAAPPREERRPSRNDGPPRIAPVHEPFFTWRKLPLLAVPASLYLAYGRPDTAPLVVFILACVAVLPLAGYMGEATEHLAARTGPALGGLLNATFGNAAELIIAIVALQAGLVDLVKASITGSILGNLLLIMGLSLIAGSLRTPLVRFNRTAAGASAGMLALAVTGLIFPAILHGLFRGSDTAVLELHLSESVAVVLAITYGFSLLFALKTHSRMFAGDPHPMQGRLWSVPAALLVLATATVFVALESEVLVHAVESLTREGQWLSETFLGLIVIPIIGNAAEHATAVVVARKGKVDLALNIAMGSSTQVALLVAPLLVFIGALIGPNAQGHYMNLVFSPLEVVAVGLSTLLTAIVTLDGESHWFEGVQLLALYAMVAIAVFFV